MAEEVLDEGGATADKDCVLIINSTEISSASFVPDLRLSDEQQANIRDFTTTTDDPWTSVSLTNVQLDILKNYKIFVTVEERFRLTKLIQRSPEWFVARKKRITASIFRHLFVDVPDPSSHFLKDHIMMFLLRYFFANICSVLMNPC